MTFLFKLFALKNSDVRDTQSYFNMNFRAFYSNSYKPN